MEDTIIMYIHTYGDVMGSPGKWNGLQMASAHKACNFRKTVFTSVSLMLLPLGDPELVTNTNFILVFVT